MAPGSSHFAVETRECGFDVGVPHASVQHVGVQLPPELAVFVAAVDPQGDTAGHCDDNAGSGSCLATTEGTSTVSLPDATLVPIRDDRTTHRHYHLPLHRHRGVNASSP